MTDLNSIPITLNDGSETTLAGLDGPVLVVNTASRCGMTPQYEGLESLWSAYRDRGLTVLGVPCNQFMEQEPGTDEDIAQFCSTNYGVTFPLAAKTEVNGANRHPLYAGLTRFTTEELGADITWNFEKFLVGRDGTVRARFAPPTTPEDPQVVSAIESALAA